MTKETAMQKLLNQLKDERQNLPMNIEWDRCYQAIEMVIQTTYLSMEKDEVYNAWNDGYDKGTRDRIEKISNPVGNAEQYYNKTFKSE